MYIYSAADKFVAIFFGGFSNPEGNLECIYYRSLEMTESKGYEMGQSSISSIVQQFLMRSAAENISIELSQVHKYIQ